MAFLYFDQTTMDCLFSDVLACVFVVDFATGVSLVLVDLDSVDCCVDFVKGGPGLWPGVADDLTVLLPGFGADAFGARLTELLFAGAGLLIVFSGEFGSIFGSILSTSSSASSSASMASIGSPFSWPVTV